MGKKKSKKEEMEEMREEASDRRFKMAKGRMEIDKYLEKKKKKN